MKSTNKCLEWELFSKSVNSNAYHIKKVERNVDAVKVRKLWAGNIKHCVELLMNDQNRLRTDLNMIGNEIEYKKEMKSTKIKSFQKEIFCPICDKFQEQLHYCQVRRRHINYDQFNKVKI